MEAAQILIIAVGVALVALGVYGATPNLVAWRRLAREARQLGVYSVSEAFPLLKQDLRKLGVAPPAEAGSEPPVGERAGILSEVDLLHQEVDVLRREIGQLKGLRRRGGKTRLPAAVLPAALHRRVLEVRRHRAGSLTLAPAAAGTASGRGRSPRRVA